MAEVLVDSQVIYRIIHRWRVHFIGHKNVEDLLWPAKDNLSLFSIYSPMNHMRPPVKNVSKKILLDENGRLVAPEYTRQCI